MYSTCSCVWMCYQVMILLWEVVETLGLWSSSPNVNRSEPGRWCSLLVPTINFFLGNHKVNEPPSPPVKPPPPWREWQWHFISPWWIAFPEATSQNKPSYFELSLSVSTIVTRKVNNREDCICRLHEWMLWVHMEVKIYCGNDSWSANCSLYAIPI